jgi:hypothetical protein
MTFFPIFHTQFTSDFFVAEHYGLQNTAAWWTKDLAFGLSSNIAKGS